jgi:hypothetical protein
MGDVVKKLLMFSDIEGCQASPGKQSKFLCSKGFYDKLGEMLGGDPNLHIAFLGDYFDQGMLVYDSIKGMEQLYDNNNDRVHIILGNRDVNKLRFCFELANAVNGLPKGSRWTTWDDYYDGLPGKTGIELVKHILSKSMGADKTEKYETVDKMTGLYSFMPHKMIATATEEDALKYLKASLGIIPKDDTTQDARDLLGFFNKCKLAHVFDGTYGKVLLAHGGGFDPEAFFDQAYVDSFKKTEDVTGNNYHSMLEEMRRKLSSSSELPEKQNAKEYGNDQSIRNKYNRKLVPYSVHLYNTLLKEVLKELIQSPPKFTWKFVLLQALGLKPDKDKEDARYKSLIQSCSQDGCKGPNTPLTTDPLTPDPADAKKKTTKLAKILKDSGITHVSYGHKPICFPIPVIYRREEVPDVTFISNDTSNGNRKVEEIGENTAIGTMVIFDPKGVQSKIEPIELSAREGKVDDYKLMFNPLKYSETPMYKVENINVLTYNGEDKGKPVNKDVRFNYKGYGQLHYAGGRRRSRNRKRNTKKRGSKRVSKRTRRNKHHTKHSRKMRKQ